MGLRILYKFTSDLFAGVIIRRSTHEENAFCHKGET